MTLKDIEQQIADKQTELGQMLETHNVVEQESLILRKQIHELQGKKKDLDIALGNSSFCIKKINLEIKQLTAMFWAERNG